jgi:hypothetical protein
MYHNKRPPIINAIHPTTTPIIITIDMPLVPAPFSGPTDVFFVLELTKGEVKLGLELLVFLTTWTDLSPNLSIWALILLSVSLDANTLVDPWKFRMPTSTSEPRCIWRLMLVSVKIRTTEIAGSWGPITVEIAWVIPLRTVLLISERR